jgi:methyl-accepting chemotaxis protein
MPNTPPSTPIQDPDACEVDAISNYLGVPPETLERLQLLREQVTTTLNQEFAIVATDLEQLRSILSDAAVKLSGTFRVVTASSEDLRRTIGQVRSSDDLPALKRLGEIADEMASTSGATVQSLQFEDMASQLLQHVDTKLAVLAHLAEDMAVINPSASALSPHLGADQLDQLFAKFDAYRNTLEVGTRKVVQQQSLESGDIELF